MLFNKFTPFLARRYHVSLQVFDDILEQLSPFFQPSRSNGREQIPLSTKLKWFLRKMATPCRLREIAEEWGESRSTVQYAIEEVAKAIVQHMLDELLFFTMDDVKENQEYFLNGYGLADIFGVMDGTHVPIYPPKGTRDNAPVFLLESTH